jgi:hypothetical protein
LSARIDAFRHALILENSPFSEDLPVVPVCFHQLWATEVKNGNKEGKFCDPRIRLRKCSGDVHVEQLPAFMMHPSTHGEEGEGIPFSNSSTIRTVVSVRFHQLWIPQVEKKEKRKQEKML